LKLWCTSIKFYTYFAALIALITPITPLYWRSVLNRAINKKIESVIDLGGGTGTSVMIIKAYLRREIFAVNCEICLKDLKESKRRKSHNLYILCDVRKLPIKKKSFDVALISQTLEHLTKKEGIVLLKEIEGNCKRYIVAAVPNKCAPYDSPDPENLYQGHISEWSSQDLQKLGYEVIECGAPWIQGKPLSYYTTIKTKLPRPFLILLGFLTGEVYEIFVSFLSPLLKSKRSNLIAVKTIREEK